MNDANTLSTATLAFVGGGNMARCLIGGALDAGVSATRISVGEPGAEQRARLASEFGVRCTPDNKEAVAGAAIVVLAVKPQAAAAAATTLAGTVSADAAVVSIMAGIRLTQLRAWIGAGPSLVRAMPNTPALIRMGITALYGDTALPARVRARVEALLATAGETVWVDDEGHLDAVTALSGSGPAYVFLVAEALTAAGAHLGLSPVLAGTLAVHTLRGAAEMALRTGTDPAELRRQVTSPGGTTAAAIEVLEAAGVRGAFARAVAAGAARSRELADEFGRI